MYVPKNLIFKIRCVVYSESKILRYAQDDGEEFMNSKLLKLAKKYYQFLYKTSPVFATYLGVHKYDHLLGDFSKLSIERDVREFKKFLVTSNKLHETSLKNLSDRIDLKLLKSDIELNILSLEKFKDWQKNPNLYVETPLVGIFLLVSRDSLPLAKKVRSITSRLNLYPKMLSQARSNVVNPPKIYTEIALETTAGAKSFLAQLTIEVKSQGRISGVDGDLLSKALTKAQSALTEFEQYLKKDLLPKSKGDFALGRNNFEMRLKLEHFLPYDAEQLREIGRKEFDRIERELVKTGKALDKSKTWQSQVEEYRKIIPSEDLLPIYKKEVEKIVKFLKKKKLVTFPVKEVCKVEETPSFERPTVPYAAYMPPAVFEKTQVGNFWVTPINQNADEISRREQLKEHSLLSFMITTLHESYPGHHLQFCLANQNGSLIRKHGQSSLLCEGWALYCEQMMGEEGYYSDPRTQIFMLKDELWRSARVIIDVGLHCFGMTVKEAQKMLVEDVKLAPDQALSEVRRYTMSPTQPMSYLVGKLLILEMRAEARRKLGKKFSLKKFHDAFLARGTIPQPLIKTELFGGL